MSNLQSLAATLPSTSHAARMKHLVDLRKAGWVHFAEAEAIEAMFILVEGGNPQPSNRDIERAAGVGRSTVQRARRKAVKLGLMLVKPDFDHSGTHSQQPNKHTLLEVEVRPVPMKERPPRGHHDGTPSESPYESSLVKEENKGSVRAQGPLTSFERAAMQLVAMGKPVPVAWI